MHELLHKAHKLRGATATLALPQLSKTAGKIEAIAAIGDISNAAELLPLLEQDFDQAAAALRIFLSAPASNTTNGSSNITEQRSNREIDNLLGMCRSSIT
jgi:HPt (histidine-containing phosphotransfer) domain-containing protein